MSVLGFEQIYLFILGCTEFSSLHTGFSLVGASRGYFSLQCAGFSLLWFLLLGGMGSRVLRLQ